MNRRHACLRWTLAAALIPATAWGSGTATAAPQTRLINRDALAIDPATHTLYAVDQAQGRVWMVDCASGHSRAIAVGHEPDALTIDPRTHRIYVVNAGGGTVSVIDGGRVIATVPTDAHAYAIALDSSLGLAFVSNTFSNLLTRIDLRTSRAVQLPLGSQDFLSIDEPRHRLIMFGYESPVIHVLDEKTGTVTSQQAVPHLWGLAVDAGSGTVYVPEIGSNALYISARKPVPVGALPDAVALDPKRQRIFVANYGSGTVSIVDAARRTVIATVPAGARPQALLADTRRGLVYVANTHSNSITVFDEASGTVRATLDGGTNPYALALDPASGAVYAATYGAAPYFNVPNRALLQAWARTHGASQ